MNRFETLMHRHLEGNASEEETAEFKHLLNISEDNEAILAAAIDEEVTIALNKLEMYPQSCRECDPVLKKLRIHFQNRHGLKKS
jgi:hypothetical protein